MSSCTSKDRQTSIFFDTSQETLKREDFAGIYMVKYVVRVIEQWRNRYLFAGTSWLLLLDNVWRMTVFRQRGKHLTGWISHDSRPGKPFALSQSLCLGVSSRLHELWCPSQRIVYCKPKSCPLKQGIYMILLTQSPLRSYKIIKFQAKSFEFFQ